MHLNRPVQPHHLPPPPLQRPPGAGARLGTTPPVPSPGRSWPQAEGWWSAAPGRTACNSLAGRQEGRGVRVGRKWASDSSQHRRLRARPLSASWSAPASTRPAALTIQRKLALVAHDAGQGAREEHHIQQRLEGVGVELGCRGGRRPGGPVCEVDIHRLACSGTAAANAARCGACSPSGACSSASSGAYTTVPSAHRQCVQSAPHLL